jgi:hypothetical protein
MAALKNIGPNDRHIPAAKVSIAKGAQVEIGAGPGQVPVAIASEYANDEPQRWKIVDQKKGPGAGDQGSDKS